MKKANTLDEILRRHGVSDPARLTIATAAMSAQHRIEGVPFNAASRDRGLQAADEKLKGIVATIRANVRAGRPAL